MTTETAAQDRPLTVRELNREIARIEAKQLELKKLGANASTGAEGRTVKQQLEVLRQRRNQIIISDLPLARQRGDDRDIAPAPPELPVEELKVLEHEARERFQALRHELAGLPALLRHATANDPMAVPPLRHRREELAELVVAAEIAALTLQIRLASTRANVDQPALRAATELVEQRRAEVAVAEAALDAALNELHAQRSASTETIEDSRQARVRLSQLVAHSSRDAGPVVRSRPHAVR